MRVMMPDDYNAEIQLSRGSSGFRLGLMSDFGLDTSDADDITLDDIIYVDCDESGGIISGFNPRSVLLAVYDFYAETDVDGFIPELAENIYRSRA